MITITAEEEVDQEVGVGEEAEEEEEEAEEVRDQASTLVHPHLMPKTRRSPAHKQRHRRVHQDLGFGRDW